MSESASEAKLLARADEILDTIALGREWPTANENSAMARIASANIALAAELRARRAYAKVWEGA